MLKPRHGNTHPDYLSSYHATPVNPVEAVIVD
jgi:hypothetical protein